MNWRAECEDKERRGAVRETGQSERQQSGSVEAAALERARHLRVRRERAPEEQSGRVERERVGVSRWTLNNGNHCHAMSSH